MANIYAELDATPEAQPTNIYAQLDAATPSPEMTVSAPAAIPAPIVYTGPQLTKEQQSGLPAEKGGMTNDSDLTAALYGDISKIPEKAGKYSLAAAADAAGAIPALIQNDESDVGNLKAAWQGKELPIVQKTRDISQQHPVIAATSKIAQGLAQSAPYFAMAAFPAAAGRIASVGFAADMVGNAGDAATVFGDEMGKNPKDRNLDKLTTAVSSLAQAGVFAPITAFHGITGKELVGGIVDSLKRSPATPKNAMQQVIAKNFQGERTVATENQPTIITPQPIEPAATPTAATVAKPTTVPLEPTTAPTEGTKTVEAPAQASTAATPVSKPSEVKPQDPVNEALKSDSPTTGIKNAAIDAQRAERGLEPIMKPEAEAQGPVWDAAMKRIEDDPAWQDRTIADLLQKPRAMTPEETFGLIQREADLRNEYDKATQEAAKAIDEGRTADAKAADDRANYFSDRMSELERATEASGTEWGKSGVARKRMANDDFSLAAMEMTARKAKGWKPLTPDEKANLVAEHKKIVDAMENEHRVETEKAAAKYKSEIDALANELKTRPKYSSHVTNLLKGFVERANREGDAAALRIKDRLSRTSSGIDPTVLKDVAEVVVKHLANGAESLAEVSGKLIDEFSEAVKPYIEQAFEKGKSIYEGRSKKQALDPETVNNHSRPKKTISPEERKAQIIEALKDDPKDKAYLSRTAREIAKGVIEGGEIDREKILDQVHQTLKEGIPDITRRQAMDAVSRYGQYAELSKEAAQVRLREVSGEYQQMAKIEDIQAKKPLLKTGQERPVKTNAHRWLEQQVNALKKKFGIVTTDPVRQLKSALDSRKTYTKNRIADLRQEIDTRERIVKERSLPPSDPELKSLRDEYAEVKKEHDAIFGKREISDEQRHKMSLASAEKQQAIWNGRLERAKKGDFSNPENPSKKITSPQLEAIRAGTDAVREQVKELRDLDPSNQAEKAAHKLASEKAALEKDIAAKESALKSGDLDAQGKPNNRPASNPEIEQLKLRRDALNKQISEARKTPAKQKYADHLQRNLERIEKTIADKTDKLSKGDLSSGSKPKQNRPMSSPELESARQRLEEVNKQIDDARKAAKPQKSADEIANQRLKTRLKNQEADLRKRINDKDYSPRSKSVINADPESIAARARVEKLKNEWRSKKEQARIENRTAGEKLTDAVVAFTRFSILSSPTIVKKLFFASLGRLGSTALDATAGSILRRLPGISKIADNATFEGRMSPKAVLAGVTSLRKGVVDALKTAWTGESELSHAFGKPHEQIPGSVHWVLNSAGRLHATIKAPIKRFVFEMSLVNGNLWNEAHGVNIEDPVQKLRIQKDAYNEAERSIFQDKNDIAERIKAFERKRIDKDTGQETLASKAIRTATGIAIPIRRVPANIVAESLDYLGGSVLGGAKAVKILRDHAEALNPAENDQVMRHLKKGAVGPAIFLLGWYAYNHVGGFYQNSQIEKKKDVKSGDVKIGGVTIDHNELHAPFLQVLQAGATFHQEWERTVNGEEKGPLSAAGATALGLVRDAPMVRETFDFGQLGDPNRRDHFFADWVKSRIVPQGVQKTAEYLDKDEDGKTVKRYPKTFPETLKTGIPGLRKDVSDTK